MQAFVTAEVLKVLGLMKDQNQKTDWQKMLKFGRKKRDRVDHILVMSCCFEISAYRPLQTLMSWLYLQFLMSKACKEYIFLSTTICSKVPNPCYFQVQELHEEESQWVNYDKDELFVKMQLADGIFDTLLKDTVDIFIQIQEKQAKTSLS